MVPAIQVRPDGTRTQALVLLGFLGFQLMDGITTHIGLVRSHPEFNRLMATVLSLGGELAAYAVKGVAIAILLALLMLLQRRRPRVWSAIHAAAWVSAAAVVVNLFQLIG